jgi:hypothetical protein
MVKPRLLIDCRLVKALFRLKNSKGECNCVKNDPSRQYKRNSLKYVLIELPRAWKTIEDPKNVWQTGININLSLNPSFRELIVHNDGVVSHRIQSASYRVCSWKVLQIRCQSGDVICVVRISIDGTWQRIIVSGKFSLNQ